MKSKFTDKLGREIELTLDDSTGSVDAAHNGKRIGWIEVSEPDDMDVSGDAPYRLTGMDVAPEYQRAGIAGEMLRVSVSAVDVLAPPPHDHNDPNRMTIEGAALVTWAVKRGLVHPIQLDRP